MYPHHHVVAHGVGHIAAVHWTCKAPAAGMLDLNNSGAGMQFTGPVRALHVLLE